MFLKLFHCGNVTENKVTYVNVLMIRVPGSGQCCDSELSLRLQCQHPYQRALTVALKVALLVSTNAPGKAVQGDPSVWTHY